jgi:ribose transport system substrate-binding protein
LLPKIALGLTAALTFAGCSSSGGSDKTAGGNSSSSGKVKTFAVVQILNDPFFTAAFNGAKEEGDKRGVKVTLTGPAQNDTAQQVASVQSLVAKQIDGIILSPGDATALEAPVQQADAAKIPTVLYNSTLANPNLGISTVVSDNFAGAEAGGEYMCQKVGDNGKVAIVEAVTGIPVLKQRWDGFKQGLKAHCPNAQVVAELLTNNEIDKGAAEVASLFSKHPDITGIYADDGNNSTALVQGLEQAKPKKRPTVLAFDFSKAQADLLQKGSIDALIAQKPKAMGAKSVDLLLDHLAGKPVEKNVNVGFVLVTPDNFAANQQWMY